MYGVWGVVAGGLVEEMKFMVVVRMDISVDAPIEAETWEEALRKAKKLTPWHFLKGNGSWVDGEITELESLSTCSPEGGKDG